MSKHKGRRRPLASEIKSVLRAPPDGEDELEPDAAEGSTDDDPRAEDELEGLAGGGNGADASAAEDEGEGEPEPSGVAEAPPRRGRLRAVRASQTDVTEAPELLRADEPGLAAFDADAVARWGDDGGPAGDAYAFPFEAVSARGAEDDADDGAAVRGAQLDAFPAEAEGDDTEAFLRGLVEALLFTSQKPLDLKDIARSAGIDKPRARELLAQLIRSYEGRGLCIEEVAGGFVMRSSPRYAPYIQKILALRPVRLSRAQLETLAIVAYRQPVTKPEVDDIRGVDSGQVIKGLLERSLLKMLGRKDEPGRPTLYGTTTDFLELLNLQSLKDLPTLREYTELSEESQRKFLEETGEAAPSETMTFERPVSPPASESAPPGSTQDDGVTTEISDELDAAPDDRAAVEAGDESVVAPSEDDEAADDELEPEAMQSERDVDDVDASVDDVDASVDDVDASVDDVDASVDDDENSDDASDDDSDDDDDDSNDDDDDSDDDDDDSDDDDDDSDDDDDDSDDDELSEDDDRDEKA